MHARKKEPSCHAAVRSIPFRWGFVLAVATGCSSTTSGQPSPEVDGGPDGQVGGGGRQGSGGSRNGSDGGAQNGGATATGGAAATGGSATGGVDGASGMQTDGSGGVQTGGTGGTDTEGNGGMQTGDAGTPCGGGRCAPRNSCEALTAQCQGESCCATVAVPGGTLMMGRSEGGSDACDLCGTGMGDDDQPEHAVILSDYYLDKYEVTVGRFRSFVEAYENDWRPAVGSGAHPTAAGTGWQAVWDVFLPADGAALVTSLKCDSSLQTWTDSADQNEAKGINCVSWYAAQAFCTWDGGRLPTEAEWEYAAAGGSENRLWPWGDMEPECVIANFIDCDGVVEAVGASGGVGRWGHEDLGGNLYEWTFDWYDDEWYGKQEATGTDVVNVTPLYHRVIRGGALDSPPGVIRATHRELNEAEDAAANVGFRCVRASVSAP